MKSLMCDLIGIGGLSMVGVGLWWLAPWASMVCIGAVFIWAGIRWARL